jgi:cyclic pyranopterin phosphate synthase
MIDVGEKPVTRREAVARGCIRMSPEAFAAVSQGSSKKGDVLGVARIAGIQAAKRTPDWIPLAHPLPLDSVEIEFSLDPAAGAVEITARVMVTARTGVEMEALVAVSAAALTIYDMCKSIDRAMVIDQVRLERKTGGKSGPYERGG